MNNLVVKTRQEILQGVESGTLSLPVGYNEITSLQFAYMQLQEN